MRNRYGWLASSLLAPVLAAGWLGASTAWAGPSDALRARFQAAIANPGSAAQDDPAELKDYLLYPYLQAARLRRDLRQMPGAVTDARIARFLSRHGEEPVAAELRVAWLLNLAAREQWQTYLATTPQAPDDDLLRCHWLNAKFTLGDTAELQSIALDTWLRGRSLPKACDPVFGWLAQQGALSNDRVLQRIDAALDARQPALVRYLARGLPDAQARPLVNAALLQETPTTMLDRLIESPDAPVAWRWIEQAFDRIARRDSATAMSRYDRLIKARDVNAEQRAMLRRSLALGLAYDRDERALAWFADLPADARDEQTLEWNARAALYQADWSEVLAVIGRMPATLADTARWRYWRARALERLGQTEQSEALFRALTLERDPYGFFAADRLGVTPDLGPQALPRDASAQAQIMNLAGIQRALELRTVDMDAAAVRELYAAIEDLNPSGRLQTGLLLNRIGWYAPSIALMAESQQWDDLLARFPLPFRERVDAAAKDSGLPPDWVYSVMRAESLYDPRAVSGANAYGLLQLLPTTAREVAQRHGLPMPTRDTLKQADVNIPIGSHYLAELDERFDGHFLLVIAAYNAGPYRIPGWLPPQEMDADVWIENVPFNETRGYITRVLYNIVIFGWRLNGEPTTLDPLMQPVPARLGESE